MCSAAASDRQIIVRRFSVIVRSDYRQSLGALARYSLEGLPNKVLAAEYKVVLPAERALAAEIDRTRRLLETRGGIRRSSSCSKYSNDTCEGVQWPVGRKTSTVYPSGRWVQATYPLPVQDRLRCGAHHAGSPGLRPILQPDIACPQSTKRIMRLTTGVDLFARWTEHGLSALVRFPSSLLRALHVLLNGLLNPVEVDVLILRLAVRAHKRNHRVVLVVSVTGENAGPVRARIDAAGILGLAA